MTYGVVDEEEEEEEEEEGKGRLLLTVTRTQKRTRTTKGADGAQAKDEQAEEVGSVGKDGAALRRRNGWGTPRQMRMRKPTVTRRTRRQSEGGHGCQQPWGIGHHSSVAAAVAAAGNNGRRHRGCCCCCCRPQDDRYLQLEV